MWMVEERKAIQVNLAPGESAFIKEIFPAER